MSLWLGVLPSERGRGDDATLESAADRWPQKPTLNQSKSDDDILVEETGAQVLEQICIDWCTKHHNRHVDVWNSVQSQNRFPISLSIEGWRAENVAWGFWTHDFESRRELWTVVISYLFYRRLKIISSLLQRIHACFIVSKITSRNSCIGRTNSQTAFRILLNRFFTLNV